MGARTEVEFESYGDKALMETKEEREVNTKLKEIEDRLAVYHNTDITQVLVLMVERHRGWREVNWPSVRTLKQSTDTH